MSAFLKTLSLIAGKLLKVELSSTAGKVNLLGGIIITILVGVILVKDALTVVLNFILSFCNRSALPDISDTTFVITIIGVIVYFYLCVKSITATQS